MSFLRTSHGLLWCLAGVVSALVLGGCSAEDRDLRWSFRFTDTGTFDDARVVEAVILEGGCDGTRTLYSEELSATQPAPNPPKLRPGVYGFSATARDATCQIVARGCVDDVPLPLSNGAAVEVALSPTDGGAACAVPSCSMGFCSDPGRADAGP